jgi:hypothetical protein
MHTIEEVAQKIGTGPRAVMDAEKGKASTGIAVYAALLWAYDLLQPIDEWANPAKDDEGLTLAAARGRTRARRSRDLDRKTRRIFYKVVYGRPHAGGVQGD